jgi:hypothetical protein
MNKKYLIYGAVGVVVLIAIYYATKSPDQPTNDEGIPSEDEPTSSSDKTKEQITIDPKLASITQQKNWVKNVIGKSVYSKLDNVKLRKNEFVNDGLINNLYGEVEKKDTLLGVVKGAYLDKGKATNPATKSPYNWFQIKLSDAVYEDIQKNQKNFATRDLFKAPNVYVFVREDVIKL